VTQTEEAFALYLETIDELGKSIPKSEVLNNPSPSGNIIALQRTSIAHFQWRARNVAGTEALRLKGRIFIRRSKNFREAPSLQRFETRRFFRL
jgi:hypothetical protein